MMLQHVHTCTVSFEKYGNTEIVKVRGGYLCNIKKLFIQCGHVKQPKYIYILLVVLVCSIAVYFYESCSILASPKGKSKYK